MKLRRNILIVFSCLGLAFNASASAPYLIADSGNAAYAKNNYDKAITFYTNFLNDGYQSAQVYYNLGNCYYRKGEIANAILNYEKAKSLNPSDADIDFNLQLANLKTADKITPESSFFITLWVESLINMFSERGWGVICIVMLILGFASLAAYMVSRNLYFRQVGFWGGTLLLFFSLITFLFARTQYNALTIHDTAIVMSGSVTVKAAPDDKSAQLFIIHDGTKVSIIKSEGAWTEVRLANGNQGWLQASDILPI